MEGDEFSGVEDFVGYLLDEDRTTFTHEELAELSYRLQKTTRTLRTELEGWGLALSVRATEKAVRGYTAWDENIYQGNPMSGGTGHEQITGFAGQKG